MVLQDIMLRKLVYGNKKSKWKGIEKQHNRAAMTQFMARRGVDWPSRQPLNNYTDIHHHLKQRQQDLPLEKRKNIDQVVDENNGSRSNTDLPPQCSKLDNRFGNDYTDLPPQCSKLDNCFGNEYDDAKRHDHILDAHPTVRRKTKFCLRSHKQLDDVELSRSNDLHPTPDLNDHHIVKRKKIAYLHAHTTSSNPHCVESKEKQVQNSNITTRNCFLELNETNNIQSIEQPNYRHTEIISEHGATLSFLYPNLDEFYDDNTCPQWVIMESILANKKLNASNIRMNNLYPNLDEFKSEEDDCR